MDFLKLSILIFSLLTFQACGGSGSSSESDDPGISSSSVFIEHGGDTIAYVLSIGNDQSQVYIPSVDRYANINILNGVYTNGYFHYSLANCTGDIISTYYPGEVGKTILFDDSNSDYYLATNRRTTSFTYNSYKINGTCTNASATLDINSYPALTDLQLSTRPYNFEALPLPLNIQFK